MSDDLAFPVYQVDPVHPGLTKRELLAAMIFQAMIRNDSDLPFVNPETDPVVTELIPVWAKTAVKAADVLIAALAEKEEG
ncbi:MAG: hypothetical protein KME45_27415 [Stenomitos rutilans HA7619-LM2]|jgi:hypothetical protein|nr:hypothetical protein [Stenomitos rutilans HA7619-LM2]